MVKATSIDMALSDIISSKKKSTKKGVKRPIKKAAAGGVKKRGPSAASTPRRQSGGAGRGGIRKSVGGRGDSNDKRSVRINISNLADTVLSSDLQELFNEFNLRKVSVNFNEDGTPAGTGDLTLSKFNSDRLIKKFAGVALDGKIMNFAVIETTNFVPQQKPKVVRDKRTAAMSTGGPVRRTPRSSTGGLGSQTARMSTGGKPPAKKATKKPKREPKPQKTAAELDAELDAYMSRS
ncbi:hypothetical protein L3Y34_003464 [Caenorhabditis briggsae]|uniref:Chromatin target of PRMT1 protein C-terminal domain-containing protein n=2 Tax=Caenorhabditis briggsae TaxID=6238 RepID=A0AAE9D3A8_CAEBR|nr:hypothetical protein L3Y34_003464 [Caenorhabditis briggsae]